MIIPRWSGFLIRILERGDLIPHYRFCQCDECLGSLWNCLVAVTCSIGYGIPLRNAQKCPIIWDHYTIQAPIFPAPTVINLRADLYRLTRLSNGLPLTEQYLRLPQLYNNLFWRIRFSCHSTCLLWSTILTFKVGQFLGGRSSWLIQQGRHTIIPKKLCSRQIYLLGRTRIVDGGILWIGKYPKIVCEFLTPIVK